MTGPATEGGSREARGEGAGWTVLELQMSAQDPWGVQVPALQGVPDPETPSLSPKIHAVSAQLK